MRNGYSAGRIDGQSLADPENKHIYSIKVKVKQT